MAMEIALRSVQLDDLYPNGISYGIYSNCTLKVNCDLNYAQIEYYPNLGGNIFFAAFFGLLLVIHFVQGLMWKTWTYSAVMLSALVLECVGYGARIGLSSNPFDFTWFVM